MENKQDGNSGGWFRVTIPYGIKYNKTWIINSIQSHCSVPFTVVDFHYLKDGAQFFIQDACAASALKDINCKISDEENQKLSIRVSPSAVPYSVQNKLDPEEMEQLKLTMSKRYDISQKALDLHKLRFDPELMDHDMVIILNRRNCMAATLQIIKENFPELLSLNLCKNKLYQLDGLSDIVEMSPTIKSLNLSKNEVQSVWELCKIKGLKLEELWLKGNPLCNTFPNQYAYVSIQDHHWGRQIMVLQNAGPLVSAIRDCFPTLLHLDGQVLPARTIICTEAPQIIKHCKESYKGSEILKNLILQFLLQYYLIFDSGDRQGLLNAYHDEACFSLTTPFIPEDAVLNGLEEYFKDSRDIKKVKDPVLRVLLLKHTKYDIVDSLNMLPKTQHDLNSFVVDLSIQTETMLVFSVNGVFKDVEGNSQGSVHAFTRTFILTSDSNSSLRIVNDELIVGNARTKETQSTFSTPVPMPSTSSMPTFSQKQQEMVQAFSAQSGTNLQWSQKYLEDNEWDYTKAGQVFTKLKKESKIPEEAFKQIT